MTVRKTMVGDVDSEVLAYTVGKDPELDLALVEADCIGTAAHVQMLSRIPLARRLFSARDVRLILDELVEILRMARRNEFRILPSDQDVHLAVERILTEKLGDMAKRVHTARSRNDQVAVDLRLFAKEQLLAMVEEVAVLTETLLGVARKHESVPMVGRTHLQPAMPSSVGLWASAHAEGLLDDLLVVWGAYDFNNRCPLGSAAGYGVPLAVDRKLTARLLGFRDAQQNVLYASNSRGKCESILLSACAQLMLTLSRLAEDLILYSMPEFGYFSLPIEFCTGSSIMPQKRNPDVFELVRARSGTVLGHAFSVAAVLKGLPGGYNRDLQETKEPLMEGLRVTRSSLRIMASAIARMEVNRTALVDAFRPEVFATDRALELVLEGVPFRDAYRRVKEDLSELAGRDPVEALRKKTHFGGTAGLGLPLLAGRSRSERRRVRKERTQYHGAISKLFGIAYPGLQ